MRLGAEVAARKGGEKGLDRRNAIAFFGGLEITFLALALLGGSLDPALFFRGALSATVIFCSGAGAFGAGGAAGGGVLVGIAATIAGEGGAATGACIAA